MKEERECDNGSDGPCLTLKICECYHSMFSQDGDSLNRGSSDRESDIAETEELSEDLVDDGEERLSLVNETGSLSDEEGCLIDEDDSIYKVEFPNSFAELEKSQLSVSNTPQVTSSRRSHRRNQTVVNFDSILGTSEERIVIQEEETDKVSAWLNSETSLSKQRKGILRRKSELEDDILRPVREISSVGLDERFNRKIHPKYSQVSLDLVKDLDSPGELELSRSSVGKRKRVREEEEEEMVPQKICRTSQQDGWLTFIPRWISGFFKQ